MPLKWADADFVQTKLIRDTGHPAQKYYTCKRTKLKYFTYQLWMEYALLFASL